MRSVRSVQAGWTPLFHAAAFGVSNDMCTMLVERGADASMKDNDKKTALMVASIVPSCLGCAPLHARVVVCPLRGGAGAGCVRAACC